ncbi:MAG: hypothetical protein SF123_17905 [Chloroflexota bacterium]|nr:hypothetical protein [Chloroflexota bacterium]
MPRQAVRIITRRNAFGPLLYGLGFVCSFIHPYLALAIYVLPGVYFLLPLNWSRRAGSTAAS